MADHSRGRPENFLFNSYKCLEMNFFTVIFFYAIKLVD